jgi:hypothetical protein
MYPAADGWRIAATQRFVTNVPHNTQEACATVKKLIALVEGQHVNLVAALFRSIWGTESGGISTGRLSTAKFFVVGVPGGSRGVKEVRCMLTRGTSGGRRPEAARH